MIKVVIYTAFALTAFAFNSILCRLALRGDEADPVGFTLVRLASGALTLVVISYFVSRKATAPKRGNLISAFFLFGYAICFSLAYLGLSAGTGALLLFGSVQLTMIVVALVHGETPGWLQWLGLAVAVAGLVYLVLPGLSAPPLPSSVLMVAAGAAWGVYTLRGKGSGDPLSETTNNFIWSVPMIILIAVPYFAQVHLSTRGAVLAVLSGAVASGFGYTIWYAALRHLTSTRAAVLQLLVPVIAAAGGVVLLAEAATTRLWIAAAMILGGIGLTIARRSHRR